MGALNACCLTAIVLVRAATSHTKKVIGSNTWLDHFYVEFVRTPSANSGFNGGRQWNMPRLLKKDAQEESNAKA